MTSSAPISATVRAALPIASMSRRWPSSTIAPSSSMKRMSRSVERSEW